MVKEDEEDDTNLRGVLKDVSNQLHGGGRGEDVCIAHHEFLQNVVLDGASQFCLSGSLHNTTTKKHEAGTLQVVIFTSSPPTKI